ncbi:hypothetical protein Kim5_PC00030 (plasmid) [Rhizobium sp. Kim5]|nr:hypothetical protein Kim5_PC00030 [Rhizobium sp. Kim5]
MSAGAYRFLGTSASYRPPDVTELNHQITSIKKSVAEKSMRYASVFGSAVKADGAITAPFSKANQNRRRQRAKYDDILLLRWPQRIWQ